MKTYEELVKEEIEREERLIDSLLANLNDYARAYIPERAANKLLRRFGVPAKRKGMESITLGVAEDEMHYFIRAMSGGNPDMRDEGCTYAEAKDWFGISRATYKAVRAGFLARDRKWEKEVEEHNERARIAFDAEQGV